MREKRILQYLDSFLNSRGDGTPSSGTDPDDNFTPMLFCVTLVGHTTSLDLALVNETWGDTCPHNCGDMKGGYCKISTLT